MKLKTTLEYKGLKNVVGTEVRDDNKEIIGKVVSYDEKTGEATFEIDKEFDDAIWNNMDKNIMISSRNSNFDKTTILCLQCKKEFETFINIKTGDIEPKFCSAECECDYYGINNEQIFD